MGGKSDKHAASWTLERRMKQAERIRQARIWEKSTGPRTTTGKFMSSQNARKNKVAHIDIGLSDQKINKARQVLKNADGDLKQIKRAINLLKQVRIKKRTRQAERNSNNQTN